MCCDPDIITRLIFAFNMLALLTGQPPLIRNLTANIISFHQVYAEKIYMYMYLIMEYT